MGLIKTGISAIGKLIIAGILAAAFFTGMLGVVWLSLRGDTVKVPEVVGKDFVESEKELAALGLKIKRRSFRYSEEKPNTVLDQSPRSGDTVKSGLTILVDVAQANPEDSEAPAPAKKDEDTNENSAGTTDKTKKPATGKTPKPDKKPEKTRDIISNKSDKNSNSAANASGDDKSKSDNNSDGKTDKKGSDTKSDKPAPTPKPAASPAKPTAPAANKQATSGGDLRSRRVPQ